jgi:hypothetical protein
MTDLRRDKEAAVWRWQFARWVGSRSRARVAILRIRLTHTLKGPPPTGYDGSGLLG